VTCNSNPLQVLSAAAGLDRRDFAAEMGRVLSLETFAVAFADDAAARRQRRGLLRSLAAAVACERLPLLAWRDEARAARDERRRAAAAAAASEASWVEAPTPALPAGTTPAPKLSTLLTAGSFRPAPIKGILAVVPFLPTHRWARRRHYLPHDRR
jgi:hypothetical protein